MKTTWVNINRWARTSGSGAFSISKFAFIAGKHRFADLELANHYDDDEFNGNHSEHERSGILRLQK